MLWMASASSHLLPVGSVFLKCGSSRQHMSRRNQSLMVRCAASKHGVRVVSTKRNNEDVTLGNRRSAIGFIFAVCGLGVVGPFYAKGAGLPSEQKPKLCDDACEKELENVPMITTESGLQYREIKIGQGPSPPVGFQVAANYVAMVPSGQVFDSSLEKGQPYIFRVGSGQVIKGLDEGILSMKTGGKRRLYIPGSVVWNAFKSMIWSSHLVKSLRESWITSLKLAFPKGLNSAPGRPRVAPNSPVIFDVSLEYVPGLEFDEE